MVKSLGLSGGATEVCGSIPCWDLLSFPLSHAHDKTKNIFL